MNNHPIRNIIDLFFFIGIFGGIFSMIKEDIFIGALVICLTLLFWNILRCIFPIEKEDDNCA